MREDRCEPNLFRRKEKASGHNSANRIKKQPLKYPKALKASLDASKIFTRLFGYHAPEF